MSQFDKYTASEYIEGLRLFLGMKKQGFHQAIGLSRRPEQKKAGRLPGYPTNAIETLEQAVNTKAARAEDIESSPGERYRIARDYKGFTDARVAQELGVSRELVRRWGEDISRISRSSELATLLEVPLQWLEYGGEDNLPPDSHIGVRVGREALDYREKLYQATLPVLQSIKGTPSDYGIQALIENTVMTDKAIGTLARRAGGRWQYLGMALLFAPWVPIREHGLSRRYWTDEVEAMIQEELASKPSVYKAWHSLEARCKAMGMTPDQYPKLISLHKRIENERNRAIKYGVDLNDMVREAMLLEGKRKLSVA